MNNFEFYGYDFIPGILTPKDAANLHQDLQQQEFDKEPPEYDPGRGLVKMVYKPKCAEDIFDQVHHLLETYLSTALYPTYWFCTQYYNKSYMAAHKDRGACEVSISMNISQDGLPWDLCLRDKTGRIIRRKTNPGDGVLYAGTEVTHWRTPYQGRIYTQLFLHYVKKNGKYSDFKYDELKSSPN